MLGIKYISPKADFSGYGSASRNYVHALHKKGVPITLHPRNFDMNPPPVADGEKKEILDFLTRKNIDYDVVLMQLTPDLYPQHAEKGKINIGYVAWETSLFHPRWIQSCNSCLDYLFVPCSWNVQAAKDSGIKVPVFKVPHGIDPHLFDCVEGKQFNIKDLSESTFKFYSIFQWMYRKNPEGLIRAYFNAFEEDDNVALILKSYRMGKSADKEYIKNQILAVKKDMNIGYYPKTILLGDVLSNTQMLGLHQYGDCCVGLPRGEGWCLPFFEAGVAGNPVIGPNNSGQLEFLNQDNSYLVESIPTYVSNMSTFSPWYLGNQGWYEPSTIHASELMRYVFENQKEAKEKGKLLKKNIIENFSWDKVAEIIVDRLDEIESSR